MIVDCYTHYWETPAQVGLAEDAAQRAAAPFGLRGEAAKLRAGPEQHLAACEPVDKTIVLGFESAYLEADSSNERVASYVRQHPEKLIGFAGIDPANPREAVEAMRHARQSLEMRGVAVAPAAQDFHPTASTALKVYEAADELGLPVLFHSGPHMTARSKMEYARPVLLDEVAREFPGLKLVVAHLGYPWIAETLVLLAKHENVFADVSWILHQPWEAYQALLAASQYGVTGKLLFGSGFPFASPAVCIESLYSINHLVLGTNLPTIPREELRSIVQRDTLALLGIHTQGQASSAQPPASMLEEDG